MSFYMDNTSYINLLYFSSAWLCQQSSWNRNLPIVRPSVCVAIISEPNVWISSKFLVAAFPEPYAQMFFELFFFFFDFLRFFFFVFVNMGPYGSPDFKTLLLLQITAFFLNFLPNGPHKTTFGIFKILINEIFTIFFPFSLRWDPMGVKMSHPLELLLLQITAKSFQTSPEFSSQWSSQNYVWDFWNFENWNFNDFFSFSLTWDPMGAKISKRYSY